MGIYFGRCTSGVLAGMSAAWVLASCADNVTVKSNRVPAVLGEDDADTSEGGVAPEAAGDVNEQASDTTAVPRVEISQEDIQDVVDAAVAERLASLATPTPTPTPTPTQAASPTPTPIATKMVKIIAAGSGTASEVGADTVQVGVAKTYRAALFTVDGDYVEDVAVYWSFNNSTFPVGDLSTAAAATTVTFTPSRVGSANLMASYDGSNTSVVSRSDVTGTITATSDQVPVSLSIIAGNNQSATVNENLSLELKVKVLDGFGLGIPGQTVVYSVTGGGGSIVSSASVVSDSAGVAAATVKVGTVAGANMFRATLGALQANFSATGVAGAPASLVFSTAPAGLYESQVFATQPIVTVKDSHNNTSPVSGTVTIAKQSGSGTLTGTLSASLASGVATFSGLKYSVAESGVVLRASYSSLTGDTASLTVGQVPGKCSVNDAAFTTAEGGCKDVVSGLVWSSLSDTNMVWHDAVWDKLHSGNESTQDAGDLGRTNDYPATSTACLGTCDASTTNYCHDLTEGGQTDWRLASKDELSAMRTRAAAGAGATAYLEGAGNFAVHTSTTHASTYTDAYTYNLSTGTTSSTSKANPLGVYCVRGGRTAGDRLVVISGPSSAAINIVSQPIIVQVNDSAGNPVTVQGVTITLSTSLGTLGGTTSGWTTNKAGRATINAWTLGTAGSATLTLGATGYTGTTHSVTMASSFAHACATNDLIYATADGGCKDLATGIVWGSKSTSNQTWYDVVWGGSSAPSGNASPDADDIAAGRTSDVDTSISAAGPDTSTLNYCRSLIESGRSDWRPPRYSEMQTATVSSASSHFGVTINEELWSATTSADTSWGAGWGAVMMNMQTGAAAGNRGKSNTSGKVICVRP